MSPIQFQKHFRLLEARRLLLSESADAADVAFRVGYESASQFSREYSRMFGTPPRTDIKPHEKTAAIEVKAAVFKMIHIRGDITPLLKWAAYLCKDNRVLKLCGVLMVRQQQPPTVSALFYIFRSVR